MLRQARLQKRHMKRFLRDRDNEIDLLALDDLQEFVQISGLIVVRRRHPKAPRDGPRWLRQMPAERIGDKNPTSRRMETTGQFQRFRQAAEREEDRRVHRDSVTLAEFTVRMTVLDVKEN